MSLLFLRQEIGSFPEPKILIYYICTLGISYAPAFAADFLPQMSEFYQRTRRVRLKNSGTSDKKSSRKFRYNEIPRAHYISKMIRNACRNSGKYCKGDGIAVCVRQCRICCSISRECYKFQACVY